MQRGPAAAGAELRAGGCGRPRCRRLRGGRWSRRCVRRRRPAAGRSRGCCCRRPIARVRRSPGSRPVSMTRSRSMPIASAAAVRNGCGPDAPSAVTGNACNVWAIGGYITTASVSTIVQTVSRCMVARRCSTGTASTTRTTPASSARAASVSAPAGVVRSPTPMAATPGASSRTSPPSRIGLRVLGGDVAVEQRGAGEARGVPVDRPGQRRLPGARRHVRARDGDLPIEPDRAVAGEEQVRQRRDDEAVRRRAAGRRPRCAARGDGSPR